jgi:hypothetical protein
MNRTTASESEARMYFIALLSASWGGGNKCLFYSLFFHHSI